MDQNEILWDRTSDFSAEKPISFIINGFPQMAIFESFQLLNDGTIYAARNSLFKGKLELWKNKDDGFKVKSGTVLEHFDTKYTLIALMEEVPGTIGTEFFKVSPDGQNLIMKVHFVWNLKEFDLKNIKNCTDDVMDFFFRKKKTKN